MASTQTSMSTCLILEDDWVHDETLPAVVYNLNFFGFRPTIIIREYLQRIRGDILGLSTGLDYEIHYAERFCIDSTDFWQNIVDFSQKFPFTVLNTTTESEIRAFKGTSIKTISIWHKPAIDHDRGLDFSLSPSNFNLFLSKHVLTTFWGRSMRDLPLKADLLRSQSDYFMPVDVVLCNSREMLVGCEGCWRLGVPGGIDFSRRDYADLVKFMRLCSQDKVLNKCRVIIPGGGADRSRLERLISADGLEHMFTFGDKGDINENIVSHDLYYDLLRSCHFCLPLISQSDLSYHVDRMTSAIATAIGLEKPSIMDRTTATTYGIEGIIYKNSLVDLLSLMSKLDQKEYARLAKNAQLLRDRERVFGKTSWERALKFLDII